MSGSLVGQVRDKYAAVARGGVTGDDAGTRAVAEAFGYTPDELAAVPAGSHMGLSCGNPTATAGLRPGEVVVDLGCGGGIDVLLAAKKVGPTGRAVGVDMTPEMIARARGNAAEAGATNAEFHLARMEAVPLPGGSVDCLVSNCVLNLAADKPAVFREMFRLLKPGGRVAVSDIALKRPLPPEVEADVNAYVGCVAGALLMDDYRRLLREAGFSAVEVVDAGKDLTAYAAAEGPAGCCGPGAAGCCPSPAAVPPALVGFDVNAHAASVRVYAVRPRSVS
ncbi:MAG: arsenite methyltransferase [Gemmataceae bacterium]|nr:arsenite methyltransferase [Gemmataceae bacterium]